MFKTKCGKIHQESLLSITLGIKHVNEDFESGINQHLFWSNVLLV